MQALTETQRGQWTTNGYLMLEGALSADEVTFLNSELDRIRQEPGFEPVTGENVPIGHYGWLPHAESLDPEGFMDRRDLLPYGKAFIDLIDRPNVFDLVVDIMGEYLAFSMSQAIVRPANSSFPGYTHTDGGEALRQLRLTETSRPLAVKAVYFLTDVDEMDSGNLTVFPGSHMRPFPFNAGPSDPTKKALVTPYSPGAAQLMAKAGDCLVFSHSLWHGPCRNLSGKARRSLLYNYCQLCLRQYDFETTPDVKAQLTPRQRRLLGDLGYDFVPGSYFYAPVDQVEVIRGA